MVQRLLRLPLLPLFTGAKPSRRSIRSTPIVARRLMAAPREIQPLRRAQLAAANLSLCRLWVSISADNNMNSVKPFKSFKSFKTFARVLPAF